MQEAEGTSADALAGFVYRPVWSIVRAINTTRSFRFCAQLRRGSDVPIEMTTEANLRFVFASSLVFGLSSRLGSVGLDGLRLSHAVGCFFLNV